jgi:hypothetical protein
MQSKELAVTEQNAVGIPLPPDIVLSNAIIAAKALKDVVSKKIKPVIMNGEQYLEFEDWQTCGQFYGYTVRTGDAVPVEVDGVKGAKAHADLVDVKTGLVIGGAEAYCMRDEEKWNTRSKYEWQGEKDNRKRVKIGDEPVPWFQLASMAQTRAGAKAFRNRLAWVVVLAGYRPTPAEEIADNAEEQGKQPPTPFVATQDGQGTAQKDKQVEHYCATHQCNFFKTEKMRSYAHPIKVNGKENGKWCNEKAPEAEEALFSATTEN